MITGIEASKSVVKVMHEDTCHEIEYLERCLSTEDNDREAAYIQERLDFCYREEGIYFSLIKTLDGMIETEINEMAEAMEGVYNV